MPPPNCQELVVRYYGGAIARQVRDSGEILSVAFGEKHEKSIFSLFV